MIANMSKNLSKKFPRREVITVAEAAEALACTPSTVRKVIKKGDLGAIVVNGRYRIPLREFDFFISKHRVDPSTIGFDSTNLFVSF